MANLFILEIKNTTNTTRGEELPVATLPGVTEQTVAIGAVSAQSAAFNTDTRMIRLYAGAACHVLVGDNPTATTSKTPLAADTVEYFGVTPGQKIAVIQA